MEDFFQYKNKLRNWELFLTKDSGVTLEQMQEISEELKPKSKYDAEAMKARWAAMQAAKLKQNKDDETNT